MKKKQRQRAKIAIGNGKGFLLFRPGDAPIDLPDNIFVRCYNCNIGGWRRPTSAPLDATPVCPSCLLSLTTAFKRAGRQLNPTLTEEAEEEALLFFGEGTTH